MLTFAASTRASLHRGVVDFRISHDGLAAVVRAELVQDSLSGALFVFLNRRRDRFKLLQWDGNGLWLHYRQGTLFLQQIVQEAERTADLESVEGSITIEGAAPGSKPKSAPTKTRRTQATRIEHLPEVTTRSELPADQRVCTCVNPLHVIGVDSCFEVASWAHARRKFVEAESSDLEMRACLLRPPFPSVR